MRKEKLNTVQMEIQPEVLDALKEKVFHTHSIQETDIDLDKLFFNYICDDNVSDSFDRQSATVSYMLLKKLLTCLLKNQDPDKVTKFKTSLIF